MAHVQTAESAHDGGRVSAVKGTRAEGDWSEPRQIAADSWVSVFAKMRETGSG